MVLSGIIIILALVLGIVLLFIPINIQLADKVGEAPPKEVHNSEDIREYFVEGDVDVSTHYHLNNEGTNTIM